MLLEEQLIQLQNQLLEEKKVNIRNKGKIDELIEQADFYENLHNHEQKELYELQKENELLREKNVDGIKAKVLICIVIRRGWKRIKKCLLGNVAEIE